MLSSLLTQFRHRYPQGSLTSDLLTIHDGHYVVRVCLGAEGSTLACGLGGSTTLEQAEDIATQRALERLGWQDSGGAVASITPAPMAQSPTATVIPLPVTAPRPVPSRPAVAELDMGIADDPAPAVSAGLAVPPRSLDEVPGEIPSPDIADLDADTAEVEEDLVSLGAGTAMAVDLSDIIAQTDVELQRLGWSVSQGREFLEKTYSKRSRHDLTDEELLEFLLYLETQTPPGT